MSGARPLAALAEELELPASAVLPWGRGAAKVEGEALSRPQRGRLVLVSAVTPTRHGEGKTTVAIALADALRAGGRRTAVVLRQPSLAPLLGGKGGGAGGGAARLIPEDGVALHLTGDLHAVAAAHNLLAALIDHDLHRRGRLEARHVWWRRVLDQGDRALRRIVTGLGPEGGVPRETGFDVTAASEVMAVLSLARDPADLRRRLGRIAVGQDATGALVQAEDLGAADPMAVLLRDALLPNLVQTATGTPALVHGGAFANVAHGSPSLAALGLALGATDLTVTEAGFGFDLGGEKFLQLACRQGGLWPAAVVLVLSVRALASLGGGGRDAAGLERGAANLAAHLAAARAFGFTPLCALNRFPDDSEEELARVEQLAAGLGAEVVRCDPWRQGGAGAAELAARLLERLPAAPPAPRFLYPLEQDLAGKVEAVACGVYGAAGVRFSGAARRALERWTEAGFGGLGVCLAKAPYALLPDADPAGWLEVSEVRLAAGAGFVVALLGEVNTMPALPRHPGALRLMLGPGVGVEGL